MLNVTWHGFCASPGTQVKLLNQGQLWRCLTRFKCRLSTATQVCSALKHSAAVWDPSAQLYSSRT